jgi:hypothetical protein
MAGLFILVANFSLWLGGSIFNEQAFSDTAVDTVRTERVRNAISINIVNRIAEDVPELEGSARTALADVISVFLAGRTAEPIMEDLAEDLQASMTSPDPSAVSLNLADLIEDAEPLIDTVNQQFDVNITTEDVPESIVVLQADQVPSVAGWAPLLWIGPVLGIFGLALIIASLVFAGGERGFVLMVNGIVLAVSALIFLVVIAFADRPLSGAIDNSQIRVISVQLFNAFAAQLSAQTWVLAAIGALMAVAGFAWLRMSGRPPGETAREHRPAA